MTILIYPAILDMIHDHTRNKSSDLKCSLVKEGFQALSPSSWWSAMNGTIRRKLPYHLQLTLPHIFNKTPVTTLSLTPSIPKHRQPTCPQCIFSLGNKTLPFPKPSAFQDGSALPKQWKTSGD